MMGHEKVFNLEVIYPNFSKKNNNKPVNEINVRKIPNIKKILIPDTKTNDPEVTIKIDYSKSG